MDTQHGYFDQSAIVITTLKDSDKIYHMDKRSLLKLFDKELRIDFEVPGVGKESFPKLTRFTRPAPGMNFIGYSRLDREELDEVITEQIAHFSKFDQPFSWEVYEHDLPAELPERLAAHGFALDDDPDAVLVLDTAEAPPALIQMVVTDVRRLSRPEQLDDVTGVEEQVWGGDFGWLKKRLSPHMAIPGYLSVYAAYADDQPVCTGWIYFNPGSSFASIYGGATAEGYRKRGFYSAVAAVRVQEAIRRGYRFITVGASQMSRPILERLGFRLLTIERDYVYKGSQSKQAG